MSTPFCTLCWSGSSPPSLVQRTVGLGEPVTSQRSSTLEPRSASLSRCLTAAVGGTEIGMCSDDPATNLKRQRPNMNPKSKVNNEPCRIQDNYKELCYNKPRTNQHKPSTSIIAYPSCVCPEGVLNVHLYLPASAAVT